MPAKVEYVIGNTYQKIPANQARRSRNGNRKVHDVTVFVDIVKGDPDVIEKVTFDLGSTFEPQAFTCHVPVPVKTKQGDDVWRFSTRQDVYGAFRATIVIIGAGHTVYRTKYQVSLQTNSEYQAHRNRKDFVEARPLKPFRMNAVPDVARFGIELELSSAMQLPPQVVAPSLQDSGIEVHVIDDYRTGRGVSNQWKIVPDSSIMCSPTQPNCNKFELVSPPLWGGDGLNNISRVLHRIDGIQPSLKVNRSTGFHVHIDVSSFTTEQLIKVCQQYVKYEDVIDRFMPLSRRTGSNESDQYFQSNRRSVANVAAARTNRQIHDALAACHDIASLGNLMNHSGRYYKLNLQNLVNGRQPTIEFRQHSATLQYEKVNAWIRFCVWFCMNSARLQAPTPFEEGTTWEQKLGPLFLYVIKDRALKEFYHKRIAKLATTNVQDECACCTNCAAGRQCVSVF